MYISTAIYQVKHYLPYRFPAQRVDSQRDISHFVPGVTTNSPVDVTLLSVDGAMSVEGYKDVVLSIADNSEHCAEL